MATQKLTFAKIVSTPTPDSWSQAYTAGNLAGVVALQRHDDTQETEELSLSIIGKDLLNTFESEYFTLETKNLETIKHALSLTCEKIPSTMSGFFALACIKEDVAYVLLYGNGTILLKRGPQQTILLENESTDDTMIQTSSGPIEHADIIILETKQFETYISQAELCEKLRQTDITSVAEILSPTIHEKQDGTACAILISYYTETQLEQNPLIPEKEVAPTEKLPNDTTPLSYEQPRATFSHNRRMFLTIASILGIVFVTSIIFSITKDHENRNKALFSSFYTPAEKKYDEGKSLVTLNKKLAKEDFEYAYDLLEKAKKALPKDATEMKQISALSAKITHAMSLVSGINMVNATRVDDSASLLLSELKDEQASYAIQDSSSLYVLDSTGVSKIDISTQKKTTEIKKDQLPTIAAGLGVYLGNIYVLDQKTAQIYKFVTHTKSDYFSSPPSISNPTGIAIDGSIWILSRSGTIQKFTRGQQETFALSGLDTPLKNPTHIFTDSDSPYLYILDSGNSRIVVFDKNGAYHQQYQSDILKTAKDFDIQEKNKKIYILSQKTIYQITLL